MRRFSILLLVLAACAGPDSDPVTVAERFHELRVEGDDRSLYELLARSDRDAFPLDAFPADLPTPVMTDLMGWGTAGADSAFLLTRQADTATVRLYVQGGRQDTIRLVATREPRGIGPFEWERIRWHVSLGLPEYALLESLAAAIGPDAQPTDSASVARAEAYLRAASVHPEYARLHDLDAARSLVRAAAVAEALQVELGLAETIDGVHFVEGSIRNPTDRRVNTLVLTVRDAAGDEESFEMWGVPAGDARSIWWITRLERGPLTARVKRIQVF